jgi:recombination protein RecA
VIPTGAATLDIALGVGGLPRGRIVEIYGPESSGKTTLVLSILAQAQKLGGKVALIDAEHALDPEYAKAVGCDVDAFLFSQPDYGEQALSIAERLIRSGELAVFAIDSVAALTPKAEMDGEMGQQTVGLQARMMGQAMRKIAAPASQTGTLVIFVNQIREKVGVMFGSPETTPGGRALRFYSSVRLDIRRTGSDGATGEQTANNVKVTVKKNKVAAPFRIATFDIRFGEGIDTAGCWITLALQRGDITKSGGWYTWGECKAMRYEDLRQAVISKECA